MKSSLIASFKKIPKEKKNKLIADLVNKHSKLEQAKKANETLLKDIHQIKEEFNKSSKEKMKDFVKTKEIFLESLIEKAKKKSFAKWQKAILSSLIQQEFDGLYNLNCITENIQKMMNDYQKLSFEMMSKTEKMLAEEMLEEMKCQMDLPDDLDFAKMHDEEYFENLKQKIHEKKFEQEKVIKQEGNFKNQQNVNLDFKQLYRKLARFSHPDLAKTLQEKKEKEINIKKINAAWETLDYYQLILIWMEIDPENEIDVELSEKNCKEIIQHLNEKIGEQDEEKYFIKNENPETAFYYQRFYAKQSKTIQKKIEKFTDLLDQSISDTKLKIDDIKTVAGLKRILEIIYEKEQKQEDEFDFFDLIDEEMIEKLMAKMKK
jgi:hypothetical protein